jgi:cytoskeletal protein RodZ
MTHPVRFFTISGLIVALAIVAIFAIGAPPSSTDSSTAQPPKSMDNRTPTLSAEESATVKDFQARVQVYADLHKKLESNMPQLTDKATPEEIDAHRTELRAEIKTARVGAKRGDIFTPPMETLVRRFCDNKVKNDGQDGKEVKNTIMDENVKMPAIAVNEHYPDGVPVTTMPAQLLETLPRLPAYMEYHFVGKKLVLVDAAAGVVVDFTPNVLP